LLDINHPSTLLGSPCTISHQLFPNGYKASAVYVYW